MVGLRCPSSEPAEGVVRDLWNIGVTKLGREFERSDIV